MTQYNSNTGVSNHRKRVWFNEYPYFQRIPIRLTITSAQNTVKSLKRRKTAVEMLRSGCCLCAWNGKSLDFMRFLGIEKVHRNSIKITVDLWRKRRDLGHLPWKSQIVPYPGGGEGGIWYTKVWMLSCGIQQVSAGHLHLIVQIPTSYFRQRKEPSPKRATMIAELPVWIAYQTIFLF